MRSNSSVAALLLATLLALASCGSDEPQTAPPIPDDAVDMTGQSEVTVIISDNKYVERTIVVTSGTKVTWVNEGLNRHNVFPSEKGQFEALLTETFDDGGSASLTFDVGAYPYYCSIHGTANRGQRGTVLVVP